MAESKFDAFVINEYTLREGGIYKYGIDIRRSGLESHSVDHYYFTEEQFINLYKKMANAIYRKTGE